MKPEINYMIDEDKIPDHIKKKVDAILENSTDEEIYGKLCDLFDSINVEIEDGGKSYTIYEIIPWPEDLEEESDNQ